MRLKCPKCKYYIDDELVPIIIELNKIGLKTSYCCSGHKGDYAYLQFIGNSIKNIEYGYTVEGYESRGRVCIIRWKIPKYPSRVITCSDCGSKFIEEDE